MSLQASVLIPCNDDNPKIWKHIVEMDNIQKQWASCNNHKEELHRTGIKIISEELF